MRDIGNSRTVRPGDWAIAVGSPLTAALAHTVTAGIGGKGQLENYGAIQWSILTIRNWNDVWTVMGLFELVDLEFFVVRD